MICKNCKKITFRRNRNKLCFKCYTGQDIKEPFIIDKKVWDKFNSGSFCKHGFYRPGTQEKLIEDYDVIFNKDSKPDLHGKARIIHILNQIDFTTPEGQKNFDKYLGKIEGGMKKFDDIMNKIDRGFGKLESGISNTRIKGSGRKSVIDGDIGGDIFKGKPII